MFGNRLKEDIDKRLVEPLFRIFDETLPGLGFEVRDGQMDMALDISEAFRDRKNLMIEAGVGIGKSYGYLIPAVIASKLFTNLHRPIVVATSSIQLSEQLIKDVENASTITGVRVSTVMGKGKSHYVCLERVDLDDNKTLSKELVNWAIENKSGDRANLPFDVAEAVWSKINVDRCKFEKCNQRHDCHFYKMRQEFRTADILIVNQDLLLAHLQNERNFGKGLFPHDLGMIVIDEAHNLEEKTRAFFTEVITLKRLETMFNSIAKFLPKETRMAEEMKGLSLEMFRCFWDSIQAQTSKDDMIGAERYKVVYPHSIDWKNWDRNLYNFSISLSVLEGKNINENEIDDVISEIENARRFMGELNSKEESAKKEFRYVSHPKIYLNTSTIYFLEETIPLF